MRNAFTRMLLFFESGITPELYDFYHENYEKPVIRNVLCRAKGLLCREWQTGLPIVVNLTVKEYFENIGIKEAFLGCDKNTFQNLAYKAINPWGFVGYQFGEELLMTLGYYEALKIKYGDENKYIPEHYSNLGDDSLWARGRTRLLYNKGEQFVSVTHVNEWNGRFLNKNSICDFDSLLDANSQESILTDSFVYYLKFFDQTIGLNTIKNKIDDSNQVLSWSGILAATHLCGVESVKRYILNETNARDEIGTSLDSYLVKFYEMDCDIASLISME